MDILYLDRVYDIVKLILKPNIIKYFAIFILDGYDIVCTPVHVSMLF